MLRSKIKGIENKGWVCGGVFIERVVKDGFLRCWYGGKVMNKVLE